MIKLRKLSVLVIILFMLCSCAVIQEKEIKFNESNEKVVKEYYFEPNVSVIEGTLITRLYYGPPGYGEDPNNDEQEYPFILLLDDPIKVIAEDADIYNSDISNVLEIQLVLNKDEVDIVKQYKNKHIKIQGTLFSAHTGHHHTDVLVDVDKILD